MEQTVLMQMHLSMLFISTFKMHAHLCCLLFQEMNVHIVT
ncbi:hypothetical protein AHF37_11545 [Paragonimus kellicotti]|nr:hypothetical protein AHF37_11545 [Paragonimus kellicotti]